MWRRVLGIDCGVCTRRMLRNSIGLCLGVNFRLVSILCNAIGAAEKVVRTCQTAVFLLVGWMTYTQKRPCAMTGILVKVETY